MILEFFWPKEIKQAIAECKANGSLNEEALRKIIKDTRKALFIGVIVFVIFFSSYPFFAVMALLSYFIILKLEFSLMIFERVFAPYLYGDSKEVKIKKIIKYAAFEGKIKVLCEDLQTAEEVVIGPIYGKIWLQEDLPKEGDVVTVWHSTKGKRFAMPDVNYLKRKYSLTAKIL